MKLYTDIDFYIEMTDKKTLVFLIVDIGVSLNLWREMMAKKRKRRLTF